LLRQGDIGTFPFDNRLVQALGRDRALVDVKFDNGESEVVCILDESFSIMLQDKATNDGVSLAGAFEVAGVVDYNSLLGLRRVHLLKAIQIEDFLEQ
jgi:hypothetical protein